MLPDRLGDFVTALGANVYTMNLRHDSEALNQSAEKPARSFAGVLEHLIQSLQAKHKRVGFKLTDTTSGLIASPRMRSPHELEDTLVLRDAESAHTAWVRVNTKTGDVVLDIDGRWHKVPAPVSVTSKSALVALINVYKATIARMA